MITDMKLKSKYSADVVEDKLQKVFRRKIFNTDYNKVQSMPNLKFATTQELEMLEAGGGGEGGDRMVEGGHNAAMPLEFVEGDHNAEVPASAGDADPKGETFTKLPPIDAAVTLGETVELTAED